MKASKILCASVFSLFLPLHAFAGTQQAVALGGTLPDVPDQTQQEPQQKPIPQEIEVTAEERTVLQTIHMTNLNEIKASLIAFEKVTSPEIREYAWKVVQDHVAMEEKIIALAKKYDFELVSTEQSLVAAQTEADSLLAGLSETPDAEFATVFLTSMSSSHEAVLIKLEGWETLKLSADIKDYLSESIVGIKEHQALAQAISPATN